MTQLTGLRLLLLDSQVAGQLSLCWIQLAGGWWTTQLAGLSACSWLLDCWTQLVELSFLLDSALAGQLSLLDLCTMRHSPADNTTITDLAAMFTLWIVSSNVVK
jgi:hypothetical protein